MEHAFLVYQILEEDGTEQWICEFPDLKGCIGVGDTYSEAVSEGMLNKAVWIEAAHELRRNVPKPKCFSENEYSGKFNLRIPKSLHRKLVMMAEQEEVSLNTFCVSLLAEGLGEKSAQPVFNVSLSIPLPPHDVQDNNWNDGKSKVLQFPITA